MKIIHYSTKSKKDLKKYQHNPKKMEGLFKVLYMLIKGIEIPESYKPHKQADFLTLDWRCFLQKQRIALQVFVEHRFKYKRARIWLKY